MMTRPMRGPTGTKTPRKPARRPPKQTDPVEVFCRLRPLPNPDLKSCVSVKSSSTIKMTPPLDSHAMKNGLGKEQEYTFKYVFDEYTSQKSLFDHISLPLVDDLLHGKNALLFAYGVTSSGKTFTMAGSPQDPGILPRCLDVVFNSLNELQAKKYVFKPDKMNGFDVQTEVDAMAERHHKDIMPKLTNTPRTPGTPKRVVYEKNGRSTPDLFQHFPEKYDPTKMPRLKDPSVITSVEEDNNYAVFVSFVEIYNNYIYDLLEELPYDPIAGYKPPQSKVMREDGNHNMYVCNVVEVEVKSTEEAYEVLWKGQKRRKVAHTALNTESSRSHSVFNIRLVQGPLDPAGEEVLQDKQNIVVSQMSLVDLAGSERMKRTDNGGDRLREAGNINQSLMALRKCIEALRENQKPENTNKPQMVPYRESRLTHLFKNYFDGEGKVRMVVCVNPQSADYDENIQVMQFAELTQEVQVARPQQANFNIGLTPGRRRLNRQYKETLAAALEKGSIIPEEVPPPMIYSMGPSFPKLEMKGIDDELTLLTLMQYLQERIPRRSSLLTDLKRKYEDFRSDLLDMERENVSLKRKIEDLEDALGSRDNEVGQMRKRLKSLEKSNNHLHQKQSQDELEKEKLERKLGEREYIISQARSEQSQLRMDYQAKLSLTEHTYQMQMQKEKAKIEEAARSKLNAKQSKIQQMKRLLEGESDDTISISSSDSGISNKIRPMHTRSSTVGSRLGSATSTPTPRSTRPGTRSRAMTTTTTTIPRRPRSPPPVKPKPAYNPRAHRRSKSAHEVWLDHKPNGHLDSGTLLQPQIKKRRSVTRLTEKDTHKASKYVLTTQELDSDGDLATKYVKGDIRPTAGGGSAVVFDEVEVLRQKAPANKLTHGYQPQPEDYDGEWTDSEDRCKTAIEHHGHLRRIRANNQ